MSVTQVQTSGLTNSSVTTDKIANDAITTDKITFENALVPVGGIIMWSGGSVPTGWQLCNNSLIASGPLAGQLTPNLVDRFIVGSGGAYVIGNTGGDNTVILSTGQVPYHRHFLASTGGYQGSEAGKAELSQAPTQHISVTGLGGNSQVDQLRDYVLERAVGECDVGTSGPPIDDLGNQSYGQAHENRPPYYALAFIMRVS
jgi:microcystin-dependent protein